MSYLSNGKVSSGRFTMRVWSRACHNTEAQEVQSSRERRYAGTNKSPSMYENGTKVATHLRGMPIVAGAESFEVLDRCASADHRHPSPLCVPNHASQAAQGLLGQTQNIGLAHGARDHADFSDHARRATSLTPSLWSWTPPPPLRSFTTVLLIGSSSRFWTCRWQRGQKASLSRAWSVVLQDTKMFTFNLNSLTSATAFRADVLASSRGSKGLFMGHKLRDRIEGHEAESFILA
jgi:hypothetical protein